MWQLTAVDTATRWAICEVFLGPSNTDIAKRFLDRVIRKLRRLGVHVTGVLTDNGPEFSARFDHHLARARHHPSPHPTTIPEPQRGLRTIPRHRAPRMLATGVYATSDGHMALSLSPLEVVGEAIGEPRLGGYAEKDAWTKQDEITG